MGIGFNTIARKAGEEIKKFVQLLFEARKGDNRLAYLYNSAGDDSIPLNDERLIVVKTDGNGHYVAVGVLIPSQGAKPGEKILFGRDGEGKIVSKIKMLNDGLFSLDTDTETTGDAKGDYKRLIKGVSDIHEKKDRTYKNDANVDETIKGNRKTDITGNDTENVSGNVSRKINGSLDFAVSGKITITGATINLN